MTTDIEIPITLAVEESAELREKMLLLIEEGQKDFVLNFGKCKFIDSTGLGVLVAIYKRCTEKGGSLKIKSLNDQVLKLFKLTRLDRVFDIS